MPQTRLTRAIRATVGVVLGLCVLELLFIQGPLVVMRFRVARLLSDFQSIQPTHSDWTEAQSLMARWGRWGHYDGTCSSTSCTYRVDLNDPYSDFLNHTDERTIERIHKFRLVRLIERLGWHGANFAVLFWVRDGTIVNTMTLLRLNAPEFNEPDDYGLTLDLTTQVRTRLKRSESHRHAWRILGNDEQLDDHPDYKVGRPGGCKINCEWGELSYTPYLAHSEVVRLTSYDLSCITRFRACTSFGEMLPAATDWHLYEDNNPAPGPSQHKQQQPTTCRTEPRALGRDAEIILEVDALSTGTFKATEINEPNIYELGHVRLVRTLKGTIPEAPGSTLDISPFSGSTFEQPVKLPEHFSPGNRYFVLLNSAYRFDHGQLETPRCGLLPATPANEEQIKLGIAQDMSEPDPTP